MTLSIAKAILEIATAGYMASDENALEAFITASAVVQLHLLKNAVMHDTEPNRG